MPSTQSALPFHLLVGKLRQQHAGFIAHFEVVHPEVGRIGMRHINGDQRNFGFFENMGHVRRHVLLDLELEHQVDALAHKLFGILDGYVGIVAIIELQQFHARRRPPPR